MADLFETTRINGMTLANRFVRSATWEGMADDDGANGRLGSLFNARHSGQADKLAWSIHCTISTWNAARSSWTAGRGVVNNFSDRSNYYKELEVEWQNDRLQARE